MTRFPVRELTSYPSNARQPSKVLGSGRRSPRPAKPDATSDLLETVDSAEPKRDGKASLSGWGWQTALGGWILASACGLGGCAATGQRVPRQDPEPAPVTREIAVHGRQLSFGVGARSLADEGFERIDDQAVFAVDYCEVLELGALRLEGGAHWAEDDARITVMGQDQHLESETWELSLGLNYSVLLGRLRPYVGLGASVQFLEVDGFDQAAGSAFDDDDVAPGAYVKAGLLLQVTRTSFAGVEFRHLEGGSVRIDGTSLDTDYDQILLVLGTSFPPGPW